ncbi:hypothetical protein PMAYCL1PPCAC_10648, partial [Pristionchus mayeri]
MHVLLVVLLPVYAAAITNFANCDNDTQKGCTSDDDCTSNGYTGSKCKDANGPVIAPGFGCCVGSTPNTTTTTATTTAAPITAARTTPMTTTTNCVDKLSPITGVNDCPARANLCTSSDYMDRAFHEHIFTQLNNTC